MIELVKEGKRLLLENAAISNKIQRIFLDLVTRPDHKVPFEDQIIFVLFFKAYSIANSARYLLNEISNDGDNVHTIAITILSRTLFEINNKLHYLTENPGEIEGQCLPSHRKIKEYRDYVAKDIARNEDDIEVMRTRLDATYEALSIYAHADIRGVVTNKQHAQAYSLDALILFLMDYTRLLGHTAHYKEYCEQAILARIIMHQESLLKLHKQINEVLRRD
jgi:hypothetical protein